MSDPESSISKNPAADNLLERILRGLTTYTTSQIDSLPREIEVYALMQSAATQRLAELKAQSWPRPVDLPPTGLPEVPLVLDLVLQFVGARTDFARYVPTRTSHAWFAVRGPPFVPSENDLAKRAAEEALSAAITARRAALDGGTPDELNEARRALLDAFSRANSFLRYNYGSHPRVVEVAELLSPGSFPNY